MPAFVALDTNALIHGLESIRSDDRSLRDLGRRVVFYLESLEATSTQIIVPSVVLGEFLGHYEPAEFEAILTLIRTNYVIADFGVKAATFMAHILKAKDNVNRAKETAGRTSQQIKVDALVAATALAAGAKQIVTRDRDYKTLTGGMLENCKIDDLPLPPAELWDSLPSDH